MCFYEIKKVSSKIVSTFREQMKVKKSSVFLPAHGVTESVLDMWVSGVR